MQPSHRYLYERKPGVREGAGLHKSMKWLRGRVSDWTAMLCFTVHGNLVHLGWYWLVTSVSPSRTSGSHLVPPWIYFLPYGVIPVLHNLVSLTDWLLVVSAYGKNQNEMGGWRREDEEKSGCFFLLFWLRAAVLLLAWSLPSVGLLLKPSVPTGFQ